MLYTAQFVEESIYDIDRLHIVTHGVDETDGKDNWGWRRSAVDLVQRARKMIDEKIQNVNLLLTEVFAMITWKN